METAVKVFSKACFLSGFYVQSFVFIGRGRRVFPVSGQVKIDKFPILSKQVEEPDFYVIFDNTLGINAKNFKEKSIVVFNSPEKIAFPQLKKNKIKSYFVDGTEIALNTLKTNTPNTVMLGALAKLFNKVSIKNVKSAMEGMPRENFAAFDEGSKSVR